MASISGLSGAIRRWLSLIFCRGRRRLFVGFFQKQAQLSFHLPFPSLLSSGIAGSGGSGSGARVAITAGVSFVHRSLRQHSGPQGETGGNCCGDGNLVFHSCPPSASWVARRMSARCFSSSQSSHASSKPAIKLSREVCSLIESWASMIRSTSLRPVFQSRDQCFCGTPPLLFSCSSNSGRV